MQINDHKCKNMPLAYTKRIQTHCATVALQQTIARMARGGLSEMLSWWAQLLGKKPKQSLSRRQDKCHSPRLHTHGKQELRHHFIHFYALKFKLLLPESVYSIFLIVIALAFWPVTLCGFCLLLMLGCCDFNVIHMIFFHFFPSSVYSFSGIYSSLWNSWD